MATSISMLWCCSPLPPPLHKAHLPPLFQKVPSTMTKKQSAYPLGVLQLNCMPHATPPPPTPTPPLYCPHLPPIAHLAPSDSSDRPDLRETTYSELIVAVDSHDLLSCLVCTITAGTCHQLLQ